jgi:hypothetical protein
MRVPVYPPPADELWTHDSSFEDDNLAIVPKPGNKAEMTVSHICHLYFDHYLLILLDFLGLYIDWTAEPVAWY